MNDVWKNWSVSGCLAMVLLLVCSSVTKAENNVAGDLITFNDDGAWCWFEDDRIIVNNGHLLIGSVAAGTHDSNRSGDIELVDYNIATKALNRFELHNKLQRDDHDSPAIFVRPDGRYMAMYSKHGSDRLSRWRISTNPGDATSWQPEQTIDVGAGATYSNVYRLSAENNGNGRTYNFIVVSDGIPILWSRMITAPHGAMVVG